MQSVVTHYSIPFGIDGIGAWWHVWMVPALATLILLVSLLWLLPFLRRRQPGTVSLIHTSSLLCSAGVAWGIFLLRVQQVPV